MLFDSGASLSFIAVSCVKDLGLEVETLEEPLHVSSPLGTRVNVDQHTKSSLIVIVGGLLPTHRMMLVLCLRGISMKLYPKSCTTLDGMAVDGLVSKPYLGGQGETGVGSTSGGS